jgi:hypothetical protein
VEFDESWTRTLVAAMEGKPGTIKGRLLSNDKSQRYKLLAEIIGKIDAEYAGKRFAIDGWLNQIDYRQQVLPQSSAHSLEWYSSTEIAVGGFELHISAAR